MKDILVGRMMWRSEICVQIVFTANGWSSDLSDEEILERLLALNLERAGRR